jgi:hypothetical protein
MASKMAPQIAPGFIPQGREWTSTLTTAQASLGPRVLAWCRFLEYLHEQVSFGLSGMDGAGGPARAPLHPPH